MSKIGSQRERPESHRAGDASPARASTLAALDGALAMAEHDYAHRNPVSRGLHEGARAFMPGGNTRSALYWEPFPLYAAESWGCRLRDRDGHEYLDALGDFTAGLYGHSDPVIYEAVSQVLAGGVSRGAPGPGEVDLASLLCDRFAGIERVRFCNSGTEATLYALTLARIATGREKLLAFSGAYHGGVFGFPPQGNPMNAPYDWTLALYNDPVGARAAIRRLGRDLAAVIVEPMLSNGGCIPAGPQFLAALREGCDEVGAILIFDEIVTSRMGSGGLQKALGVRPDLTTLGKYIGAGFAFGAFGGRSDLMELLSPERPDALMHAGTFNNNAFSTTVGAAALRRVFTPERAERLHDDGEALRARLNQRAREIAPAVQFTGVGSAMNIHFHRGEIARPEDLVGEPRGLFRLFHFDLLEQGVYAAIRGQLNLSLPMGEREFDEIEAAVVTSLTRRAGLIEGLTP